MMTYTLILLSPLLLGLLLLAAGVVLLLMVKKKIFGFLVMGVGLLFTLISIAGFAFLMISTRTMG